MDYLLRDTVGGGFLLESAVGDQSSICYSNSCTGSFQPIGEISFGGGRLKPLLGNTSRDDSTLPRTLAVVLGPAGGVGTVARAAAVRNPLEWWILRAAKRASGVAVPKAGQCPSGFMQNTDRDAAALTG
jgi:hypothetical protein